MRELMSPLVDALQGYGQGEDVHLILEARRSRGGLAGLFTLGKPAIRHCYTTLVEDSVAEPAFRLLMNFLEERGESYSGFEILLEKLDDGRWSVSFRHLDEPEDGPSLPRYPVRICGHGFSLAPPAGQVFRWVQTTDPLGILASLRNDQGGADRVKLEFGAGDPVIQSNGNFDWQKVVQMCEGPHLDEWWVEVRGFRFAWPLGVDARYPVSTGKQVELLGRDDSMIFMQGPLRQGVVDMNDMGAPDQREVGRGKTPKGAAWVEFEYEAEGKTWRQRQHLTGCGSGYEVVVTAQGPLDCAGEIFKAAEKVADSLLPATF